MPGVCGLWQDNGPKPIAEEAFVLVLRVGNKEEELTAVEEKRGRFRISHCVIPFPLESGSSEPSPILQVNKPAFTEASHLEADESLAFVDVVCQLSAKHQPVVTAGPNGIRVFLALDFRNSPLAVAKHKPLHNLQPSGRKGG